MPESDSVIVLTLPDGAELELPAGSTAFDGAKAIGPGLAQAVIGAEIDGRSIDLREPLAAGGNFKLFTSRNPESGDFVRHSAEHVLADAVKRLWPEVEIDVGRVDHSEKFQYDFRFPRAFTPDDLEKIEDKMREIFAEDHKIHRIEVTREQAIERLTAMGESLKIERLKDIPEDAQITFYKHGEFFDLCRGPHARRTGQIGAVKLLEASGVYWKGDEKNEMLQRIYGTAFSSQKELEAYEASIEQAQARDHRRLGAELDLFSFNDLAPASPFFGAGREENFTGCLGKDDGALVAALGDDIIITRQLPLQFDQVGPDVGVRGRIVRDRRDRVGADFVGNDLAVECHLRLVDGDRYLPS